MEDQQEMIDWLKTLLGYADGTKRWDTGGIWVCETHPLMPWDGADTSFNCECGGAGMPPYTPTGDGFGVKHEK